MTLEQKDKQLLSLPLKATLVAKMADDANHSVLSNMPSPVCLLDLFNSFLHFVFCVFLYAFQVFAGFNPQKKRTPLPPKYPFP